MEIQKFRTLIPREGPLYEQSPLRLAIATCCGAVPGGAKKRQFEEGNLRVGVAYSGLVPGTGPQDLYTDSGGRHYASNGKKPMHRFVPHLQMRRDAALLFCNSSGVGLLLA